MADKAARGTKRTCQNGTCGSRFYDLGRSPIVCPICGSTYAIAHGPAEPEREEPGEQRGLARTAAEEFDHQHPLVAAGRGAQRGDRPSSS